MNPNSTGGTQNFTDYQLSFSTAEIQKFVFEGEHSAKYYSPGELELEGEYKLVGDELMHLDRQNLPPNAAFLKRNSFEPRKSKK